jgi:hypothetical protein
MDEVPRLPSLPPFPPKERQRYREKREERERGSWDTQRRRRARRNGRRVLFSRTLRQLACGWRVSGGMQLREQGGAGVVGTVVVRKSGSQEKRRKLISGRKSRGAMRMMMGPPLQGE